RERLKDRDRHRNRDRSKDRERERGWEVDSEAMLSDAIDDPARRDVPTYNLHVSNLHSMTKAYDLHREFSKFGDVVSLNIILDRKSGRSKGYGFVHYAQFKDRDRAVRELQGKVIHGKPIRVTLSLSKCTLYVRNLPPSINSSDLCREKLQELAKVPIKEFRWKGNYCFAEFVNFHHTNTALANLKNSTWDGVNLQVQVAHADIGE
ncbi:RNA-binding region RNP-1 domain-containing protein, partial [Reticulomyxa filosa]